MILYAQERFIRRSHYTLSFREEFPSLKDMFESKEDEVGLRRVGIKVLLFPWCLLTLIQTELLPNSSLYWILRTCFSLLFSEITVDDPRYKNSRIGQMVETKV